VTDPRYLDESLPNGVLDDLASELEWIECCTLFDDPWGEWENRQGRPRIDAKAASDPTLPLDDADGVSGQGNGIA